jgi:hypothetical protein
MHGRNATAKHVFLSYCHDNRDEVARLRAELKERGETVWWDEDILPGQDWKQAIRQALRDSYAMVLCLSRESQLRDATGIYPEAFDAIGIYRQYGPGKIFLIPVRLNECEIPLVEIDDTRTLDRLQNIDLFPPQHRDAALQRLVRAIRAAPRYPGDARTAGV